MPRGYLCVFAFLPLAVLASPNASVANATLGNETQEASEIATSCEEVCAGFTQLQSAANGSTAETLAEFCLEMQLHAKTVSCVLATQQDVCASAKETLNIWRSNCSAQSGFGIDISAANNFTGSACSTCAESKGASKLSTNWAISRATCEHLCNVDSRCAAYDFYTLIGICRTWRTCGASERLSTQCTWGVFRKPGAVLSGSDSSATVSQGSVLVQEVPLEEHKPEEQDQKQEDDQQSDISAAGNNMSVIANASKPAFGIAEKASVDGSFLNCRPPLYLTLLLAASTVLGLAFH